GLGSEGGGGDVDGRVDALAQDETMRVAAGIDIQSHNHSSVVDPLGHGEQRAGHVECRDRSCARLYIAGGRLVQQEAMAVAIRVNVGSDYLSRIVDSVGDRPEGRLVTVHVERLESASAPEEAMTFHV